MIIIKFKKVVLVKIIQNTLYGILYRDSTLPNKINKKKEGKKSIFLVSSIKFPNGSLKYLLDKILSFYSI